MREADLGPTRTESDLDANTGSRAGPRRQGKKAEDGRDAGLGMGACEPVSRWSQRRIELAIGPLF